MKADSDTSDVRAEVTGPWYRGAVRTAVVGGGFCLIVLVLLSVNYVRRTVTNENRIAELDSLKLEIVRDPANEALQNRIRGLDLVVRRERIRVNSFSRRGGWLLLGGGIVFMIGLKGAASFRKTRPCPRAKGDVGRQQMREASAGRWAVTAGIGLLGAASVALVLGSDVGFLVRGKGEGRVQTWPRFRGPGGLGVSKAADIPTRWDGKTGKGILWKKKVALGGHNSPVVWGRRVFVSGANANSQEVYCFDAESGELLWRGGVETAATPNAEELDVMEDTGLAAPTMVTDGRRVCAIFATGDLACFDVKGKQLWAKSLGVPESPYGYASSLAMYRNLVLVQYDQGSDDEGKSKVIGLKVLSGEVAWQTNRPVGASWTSPIVAKVGGRDQFITVSQPLVIGYDAGSGAELWRAECMGADLAPSPIYAGGLVFAIEPHNQMVAIRPQGSGDVTKTHITWTNDNGGPDICSPVSDGQLIFLLSGGTLSCHQVSDGKLLWEEELDDYFSASPSLVGERLYILSDEGVMIIA
ncbi:MAG: outer membrane protein assembly factor BamB family protein, partial [Planctomycetota bacterium]